MAQAVKDSFLDLERHRQLLEANIDKLQKSLQHWQTLSAEYEGLKEEIIAVPSASPAELHSLADSYSADLVTKTEISEILGAKSPRSAIQVLNILDRRLDYVQQNVVSAEKMLGAAEEKLTAATVLAAPEVRNEEGLPIMEIVEELDEDGEVVSGRVVEPGSARPQLLEVLKKAGLNDLPADSAERSNKAEGLVKENLKEEEGQKVQMESIGAAKKAVTFAQDTEFGLESDSSHAARRVEEIMTVARKQNEPIVDPVIPEDEPVEDARLRMEMLHYNIPEMATVVAEMDIEGEDGFTDDEDYDDDDEDGSSYDDEDEYGRSTTSVIDEDMHQRIKDLEEKLGLRMMKNVGPKSDVDVVDEGIGRIVIKEEDQEAEREEKEPRLLSKNGVRFAQELDVSKSPSEPLSSSSVAQTTPSKPPISDVVERMPFSQKPSYIPSSTPASKPSRFKAAMKAPLSQALPFEAATTSRTVPTGPSGTTVAPSVIERTPTSPSIAEPDEFDPALLNQQVATEYHSMRNRMIQRQGGFLQDEVGEDGRMELDESEGGPRKQSAFMRARLSKIGK